MEDDYIERDFDSACPECGHTPTHYRDCTGIGCNEGFVNLGENDPNFYDLDEEVECEECSGTGVERWCPECGLDLNLYEKKKEG